MNTNAEVYYEMAFGPNPFWDEDKGVAPGAWVL